MTWDYVIQRISSMDLSSLEAKFIYPFSMAPVKLMTMEGTEKEYFNNGTNKTSPEFVNKSINRHLIQLRKKTFLQTNMDVELSVY